MEKAHSKAEAIALKAVEELKEQRMMLLTAARKSVEQAGRLLFVCSGRLDACAEPGNEVEEQDVAALMAASTNCNAAASNILKSMVIMKPKVQIATGAEAGLIATS